MNVRPEAARRTIWASLERLLRTWERRPPQRAAVREPVVRVLADFELALQAGATDEGAALLEVLRGRGELSSENLLFLELRLIGAAGRFRDLLQHPRLSQVLAGRRPSRVTALLFEALHAVYLAEPVRRADAQEALRVFRERVRPRFDPLLRSRGPLDSIAAVEALLLAAADDGRSSDERAALLAVVGDASEADKNWLTALAALERPVGREPLAADPMSVAEDLLLEGRFDDVLTALRAVEPSSASVLILLQAAVELDTLDSARAVSTAFGRLDPDAQGGLRARRLWAGHLERLLALGHCGTEVTTWTGWLIALAATDFPEAIEVAVRGALEWDPAQPSSQGEAAVLAGRLADVPDTRRDVLQQAIPHLLTFMDRSARPAEVRGPVDHGIFEILVYGDPGSRSVQETLLIVLDRLLAAGPAPADYAELIGGVDATWDAIRSARTLDWLLDAVGLLADHPCPDQDARARLFREAVGKALRRRRPDSVVLDVLSALAADLDLEDAVAPLLERAAIAAADTQAEPPSGAVPRRIGIYTLTESAAHRACSLLERRYPGVKVELNHEHDASALLDGFVGRADVVVMVIASAKHSATNAIRRVCAPNQLIEVGSRGSTAIVRAVTEYIVQT